MKSPDDRNRNAAFGRWMPAAIFRAAGFLAFWLLLSGADLADLPAAIVAVVAATWASLRLMPQQRWSVRPAKLIKLVLRFFRQSILAGIDVALCAFNPRLPLRPGFVVHQPHLSPGPKQNTFYAITSLQPGTLPSGPAEGGGVAIHCLDVTQPVVEQLAMEETLFIQALGDGQSHG